VYIEASLALGYIVKRPWMNQLAAVEHHPKKCWATRNPMGNATRYISHLPSIEIERTPLGVIRRMASKLKPNFVFVAAAMKAILFLFEIIDVNAKFLSIVKYRGAPCSKTGPSLMRYPLLPAAEPIGSEGRTANLFASLVFPGRRPR
jgi:hypothetical protein